MLVSTRFQEKDLAPPHALNIQTKNVVQRTASLLLRIMVEKDLDWKELKKVKSNLKGIPNGSLTSPGKLVKKYLSKFNKKTSFSFEMLNQKKLKKDMLQIYKGVLSGALKRANIRVAKKAEDQFEQAVQAHATGYIRYLCQAASTEDPLPTLLLQDSFETTFPSSHYSNKHDIQGNKVIEFAMQADNKMCPVECVINYESYKDLKPPEKAVHERARERTAAIRRDIDF
ncbi:hypothetical protein BD560DRAFT_490022 [Blakeslea trispora]|nr:hypothetical protein BD560DRAFT_490022 [Blakeslea trispora]